MNNIESIKGYADLGYQKDLISQLLKQAFIGIPEDRHEEMTELVFTKIHQLNDLKNNIKGQTGGAITDAAAMYDTTEEQVLDSFMYFSLVVENSFLIKQLAELIQAVE